MRKMLTICFLMFLLAVIGIVNGQDNTTIGLSVPTLEQDFYILLVDSARAAAEEAGVELIVSETDALLDVEAELANVQSLLEAGVDSLIIYPIDAMLSLGAVEAAAEANVPVILLDYDVLQAASEMETLSVVSVVTQDAEVVGASIADYLCEELDGEGTVFNLLGVGLTGEEEVELETIPAYQTVTSTAEAITSAFAETCADVTLVTEETESYANSDSVTNFSVMLEENRPDAVIVNDAALTIEVVDAARAARLRGLMVIGLERSDDVLGALEGGQVTLAIIPDPEALGSVGVTTAIAAATGDELEATTAVDIVQVDADSAEQFRGPCPAGNCGG